MNYEDRPESLPSDRKPKASEPSAERASEQQLPSARLVTRVGSVRTWIRSHRWWCAIAVAYLYCFPYFPKIHSANELPRAYLVKAMVDNGTFAIDQGVATWGSTADVSPARGHQYSNKAPGSSMLAAPFYALAKAMNGAPPSVATTIWICRFSTGMVPTLLFLLLLETFLRRFTRNEGTVRWVVVSYALGSMAMTYSTLFISHQLSAVAIASGWILLMRAVDDNASHNASASSSKFALAGLLLGAAPLIDYQALFAGVPIAVWLVARLWSWPRARALRNLAAAIAGALLPIMVLLAYHRICFGSPWKTGYDASESFAYFHQQGFLGITTLRWQAFWGSTFSGDNGLFTLAPWLLLALPGFVVLWRHKHRDVALVSAAVFVIYLLFISSINFWRGGWCLGPRYITVMLPFLLPAVVVAADAARRHPVTLTLAAASSLLAIVIYSLSNVLFPHFPERFGNPLYDVTFALFRDGAAAPNAGNLVGLSGTASLLPFLVTVAVVAGMAVFALTRQWRMVAAATGVAVVTLLAYRGFNRADVESQHAYRDYVLGVMPAPHPLW
jgi:hypothetical protein